MNDNGFDFYREFYYKEIDRNDKINSSLSIPFGIITLLISAMVFYLQNLKFENDWSSNSLIVILSLYLLCVIVSTAYLARVFYVQNYFHLPDPLDITHYQKSLLEYYTSIDPKKKEERAATDFLEFLKSGFAEAATRNTFNNDRKAYFLYIAKRWIIVSLILLLLSIVPALFNFIKHKSDTQTTRVIIEKGMIENGK